MRALLVLLFLAACGHAPAGHVRFHNQPPVWRVDDRVPLSERPAPRAYNRALYHTDGFVVRRATRAMDLPSRGRALDVNALDEVPDSTWFTNRIGVRELSLDELRRGANVDPSPFEHRPWTIKSAKIGGTSIGFVFEDARGEKFLLKFDQQHVPEMETAAHVIGHRIVWAAGYNVPQDYLGYIRRADLVVAATATRKDAFGNKSPLTTAHLEQALTKVFHEPDGQLRVLASRYLPGKPLGPYAREGRRGDDPNDVFAHERRRSLRGQAALFAWLNHTDMQEDNTLDVFVDGHVEHYLIDFGRALGVMGFVNNWKTVGYTYRLDVGMALRSLLGLGLWERPWDDVGSPALRGVGLYEAAHFDPSSWRGNSQYWPHEDADRFDGYWGAKLAMRFTRAQLAAVVDEAQFSDPRAAAYMLDTLVARQRTLARYWFTQVSPLDRFTVEPAGPEQVQVCFDDLALHYGLERVATRYRVDAFEHGGQGLASAQRVLATPSGHGCAVIAVASTHDGYTIVRLAAERAGRVLPAVRVHLARAANGAFHVIGLRRD